MRGRVQELGSRWRVNTCPAAFCRPDLGCTRPKGCWEVWLTRQPVLCSSAGQAVTGPARVLVPQIDSEYEVRVRCAKDLSILNYPRARPAGDSIDIPYSIENKHAVSFPTHRPD